MNRRGFLQSIAALAAGLALPAGVKGFQGLINSDLELIDWLETNFRCSVGAPWAFVEPRPTWADGAVLVDEDVRWGGLTPYVTVAAEAYDKPADLVLTEFQRLVAQHPEVLGTSLYWRFPDRVRVRESWFQDRGACVLTTEQYEDCGNEWPTAEQAAAMTPEMRAALESMIETDDSTPIPGCVGAVAEGAIYVAVGEPWAVRTVRARLAIPALQELALIAKGEGKAVSLPGHYEASGRLSLNRFALGPGIDKGNAACLGGYA